MRKPQEQSLPVNNSSCQTGMIHLKDSENPMEGVLKMKELADMLAECSTRLEDLANIAFVSKNEEWKENVNGFALDTWAAAECIAQIFGYAFLHVRHNIVEL